MPTQLLLALCCRLPALLKCKGRAGWDAIRDNLLLALKQLDVDAQVGIWKLQLAGHSRMSACKQRGITSSSSCVPGVLADIVWLVCGPCAGGHPQQVAAAEGLRAAVQQHSLPAADAAACLLPLAIGNVKLKDKSDEVGECHVQVRLAPAAETLCCRLHKLPVLSTCSSED